MRSAGTQYGCPAVTLVVGDPLMDGGLFGTAATVIVNGASDAWAVPSLTVMDTPP